MADWRITDGVYKDFTFHVAVPKATTPIGITDQEITTERRLQVSERPLVDAADVEDFGRKSRIFTATIVFFGADYQEQLKAFEAKLNDGKSGTLILPDLDEAVLAKFQRSSRRTNSTDGDTTVMQVTWIEDRQTVVSATATTPTQVAASAASAAIQSGNLAQAIPTIQDQAAKVTGGADSALSSLSNNPFLKALNAAESAVTNARVTINSVLNIPRNFRQQIISTVRRVQEEINGLKAAINGITDLTTLLELGLTQASPTRYNTGLGAVDFRAVDIPSTSVVGGNNQVVTTPVLTTPIKSFPEAEQILRAAIDAINISSQDLESQTGGSTSDFSSESVALINHTKDLLQIIEAKATVKVLTESQSTLLEVCFRNGLDVSEVDRVYRLNTQLDDILDIPRFTVINL